VELAQRGEVRARGCDHEVREHACPRGEKRVERVWIGGGMPWVRVPLCLRIGPATERDVGEEAHEIHPGLTARGERPVDDVHVGARQQHVVGAQVEVDEMLTYRPRRPPRFELRQLVEVACPSVGKHTRECGVARKVAPP